MNLLHTPPEFSKEELNLIDKAFKFECGSLFWVKFDDSLCAVISELKSGRPFISPVFAGNPHHPVSHDRTDESREAFKLYEKIKSNYSYFLLLQEYVNKKAWECI